MRYRLTAIFLAAALSTVTFARPTAANAKCERIDADAASLAARVKDGIRHLGIGPEARISVRRHDGKRVKGYIASADDAAFSVVTKSGESTQVQYSDVTQIKGHNLATGWKIAIGAAIGVGVVFIVLLIFLATHSN